MNGSPNPVVGRQIRALRILNCLQSGPGFNAAELAQQLNVSRRTIFRDLDLIRQAGVQIYFDDRDDAYRLSHRSQRVEPPHFDEQELAEFVLMAHLSLLQHFPGFGPSGREAAGKLLCAYPYSQRIAISRLINACACQPPDKKPPSEATGILKTILQAIRSQQRLQIVTHPGEWKPSYRTTLDPLRLQLSPHDWSVTGRSTAHRGQVTLNMRQIRSAELLSETFELPRGTRRELNGD